MTERTQTRQTQAGTGLGFGALFSKHVISARYVAGAWSGLEVRDFEDLRFSPAAMVMHYGQAIFEGLKAFRATDSDEVLIFRAADCARRFDRSAARMAMPPLPAGMFLDAVRTLVGVDVAEVPSVPGSSLYIRPVMFADEPSLAVRPSTEFSFLVLASPVDSFFASGRTMIDAYAQSSHIRAALGGTGDVKCSGNYAGAMAAKADAQRHDCDEVLWLDAREHHYVEEFGAMNCFVVRGSGERAELITPPLAGTILPGHTRATVITLAGRRGLTVLQEPIELGQVLDDGGPVSEVFACGTAAGVAPVHRILTDTGRERIIGDQPGPLTAQLAADYVAVTHGQLEPEPDWIIRIPG
ncbi:branched-chain-amino-acid aminotransferase [Microlunatus endophyticus]|uniref:branched-chain-amino-acid transaminase n=1 Tax=Microlunatus endophyticus TaxID=1716077 RepID=A0A917SCF1_9ACTN|nr:branched-chain amino acid aminotransferase [Microlunatus endophyticus]GGL71879.1 branched-chain-amino-acid aminotransferase [Microlunatus endophyticus]